MHARVMHKQQICVVLPTLCVSIGIVYEVRTTVQEHILPYMNYSIYDM
jgi:hypothetical protein